MQAKLVGDDAADSDSFGKTVDISGDTAVVGAYGVNASTGAAYIFKRSGSTWSQQAKVVSNDAVANDNLGYRVGVSGDTALVSAGAKPGVFIFVRAGDSWSQQAMLTALDGDPKDSFGRSLSISGDVAVIGAPGKADWTGAAYALFAMVRRGPNPTC